MRGRHRVLGAGLGCLVALALAGCSGSSVAGSGHSGHPAGPQGIRGTQLHTFSCAARPAGTALRVAAGSVVALRICPLSAPEPFDRPNHPISLARGSARFERLVRALSLRDLVSDEQQFCPEYAELRPTVIARTARTALLVHFPSDACGHMLPAVGAALNAVTG